jgi:rfaE bifunctional protein nucleotidyltransferase chain/domain/rfaE bifunctional protein kinase chain/domain
VSAGRRDGPVVVVGDALLDVDIEGTAERLCPDAPAPVVEVRAENERPGGAALAAALAAAVAEGPVRLVTALGGASGARVAEWMGRLGIDLVDLGRAGTTPVKTRIRVGGHSVVRVDRHDRAAACQHPDELARVLRGAAAVLVADYGRGVTSAAPVRAALRHCAKSVEVVWDPHPRGSRPVPGCRVVTPNAREAAAEADLDVLDAPSAARAARLLGREWDAHAVAVTLGERGAVWVDASGTSHVVPAPAAAAGSDSCGAGDAFAAAATVALARGALLSEALDAAVGRASAFVAAGGASAWSSTSQRGETASPRLVATCGCFDLLHAGHVALLEQARTLGDRLVVLLNSDESVRRLKGPDRPLQTAADRARVLSSLAPVDEVIVFDDVTPERALERLRPDVFVKGGDYTIDELPEARVVAAWGGTTLTLPYLPGRSTTRLIERTNQHV